MNPIIVGVSTLIERCANWYTVSVEYYTPESGNYFHSEKFESRESAIDFVCRFNNDLQGDDILFYNN